MTAATSLRRLVGRHNRRILLGVIAAMVAVPALLQLGLGYRLYFNQLMGPHEVSITEIAAISSLEAEHRRWFQVGEVNPIPLSIFDVTVKKRGERETGRDYYYYFALPGPKTVLVRSREQAPATSYLAELRPMLDHVKPRFASYHAELASRAELAPFVLEASRVHPRVMQGVMAAIGILPVVVLLLWAVRTIMRLVDWRRSPAVAALRRFKPPLDEVAAAIDAELARVDSRTPLRTLRLTPQWLISTKLSEFRILHRDEVVWICPTYQNTYFTIIPTGRRHQLRIWDRYGRMLALNGRKAAVQEAGVAIVQRAPWIFAEYTAELNAAFWRRRKGLWEKTPKRGGDPVTGEMRDRAALIKAVNERREAVLRGGQAAATA
jgi:hypothetical protein